MRRSLIAVLALTILAGLGVGRWDLGVDVAAQAQAPTQGVQPAPAQTAKPAAAPTVTGIATPADYVVGIDDVLDVVFWRDKDMSATVTVRPDGKITLPLLNDVHAAGLTPEELRNRIDEVARKLVEEPTVNVAVKQINSRKVFITGEVGKQGAYPLLDTTTVLQMIALAGGLGEYADKENIRIVRTENGKTQTFKFNYKQVSEGKNLAQNITLKPGDTIVVR